LEWKDPEVSKDMEILLRLRGTVLSLLEKARKAKFVVSCHSYKFIDFSFFARQISSSLEAEVDIILPNDISCRNSFVELLHREGAPPLSLF